MGFATSSATPSTLEESGTLPQEAIELWKQVENVVKNESDGECQGNASFSLCSCPCQDSTMHCFLEYCLAHSLFIPFALAVSSVSLSITERSLQFAYEHLSSSKRAQDFVEDNLLHLVGGVLEIELPAEKTIHHQCIKNILKLAVMIAAMDINIQFAKGGSLSFLGVLCDLFDKDIKYYQEAGGQDTRLGVIDVFQMKGGFSSLAKCLPMCSFSEKNDTVALMSFLCNTISILIGINHDKALSSFSQWDNIMQLVDEKDISSLSQRRNEAGGGLIELFSTFKTCIERGPQSVESAFAFTASLEERRKDSVEVAMTLALLMQDLSLDKVQPSRFVALDHILLTIGTILDEYSTRYNVYRFQRTYRDFALKLMSASSKKIQIFGWWRIIALHFHACKHRPPPRTITVSNADNNIANGVYTYAGDTDEDGYGGKGRNVYIKTISIEDDISAAGTKCVLASTDCHSDECAFVWILGFIGADDFLYGAGSNSNTVPPSEGWITNTGEDSPLRLRLRWFRRTTR